VPDGFGVGRPLQGLLPSQMQIFDRLLRSPAQLVMVRQLTVMSLEVVGVQ